MSKHDSISRKIFYIGLILFFILFMATVLFPYLNILAKALNDGKDTMRGGVLIWPRVPTLENFLTVLRDDDIVRAFFNTVCIVVLATVLRVVLQYMTAYAFVNTQFIGRRFLLFFFMIPMYFSGGLIPGYVLYGKLGLMNNFLVYIIPGCFSMYNMIVIRSYLKSIPVSLAEAAKMDGANDIYIAFRIYMPLAKPVLATVSLWCAVAAWNNWTTTLYYVNKKSLYTLQYVLMQVLKETSRIQNMINEAALRGEIMEVPTNVTTESIQCAQIIVTTLPIVILYPFLQKYFIKGVTMGSVKD